VNGGRPLILSVDTSTSCSSVALTYGNLQNGDLLATLTLNSKLTHSRRLLTGIDWLLQQNNIDCADVDGLAVGLGPGSFTGLRIAMATMKGMAMAMDKPLLGCSTLDALAVNCSGERPLCVLLDARKKEVYRCWYALDDKNVFRPTGTIDAVTPEILVAEVTEPVLMVGDGLLTYSDYLKENLGESLVMAPLALHYPTATAIGFLCCENFEQGKRMDLDSAVPLYVRASDAELSLVKKEKQNK